MNNVNVIQLINVVDSKLCFCYVIGTNIEIYKT